MIKELMSRQCSNMPPFLADRRKSGEPQILFRLFSTKGMQRTKWNISSGVQTLLFYMKFLESSSESESTIPLAFFLFLILALFFNSSSSGSASLGQFTAFITNNNSSISTLGGRYLGQELHNQVFHPVLVRLEDELLHSEHSPVIELIDQHRKGTVDLLDPLVIEFETIVGGSV